MFTNSIWTGTKLLDRIRKVASQKAGIKVPVDDIGLITPQVDAKNKPYFIVNDNALDKICTVTKSEIKTALKQGKID